MVQEEELSLLHAEVPYNKDMMEVHDLMDHIEMRLMEELSLRSNNPYGSCSDG